MLLFFLKKCEGEFEWNNFVNIPFIYSSPCIKVCNKILEFCYPSCDNYLEYPRNIIFLGYLETWNSAFDEKSNWYSWWTLWEFFLKRLKDISWFFKSKNLKPLHPFLFPFFWAQKRNQGQSPQDQVFAFTEPISSSWCILSKNLCIHEQDCTTNSSLEGNSYPHANFPCKGLPRFPINPYQLFCDWNPPSNPPWCWGYSPQGLIPNPLHPKTSTVWVSILNHQPPSGDTWIYIPAKLRQRIWKISTLGTSACALQFSSWVGWNVNVKPWTTGAYTYTTYNRENVWKYIRNPKPWLRHV